MKIQTAILVAVLALLLASGVALPWTAPMMAQTGGPGLWYTVQTGTVAGGSYQLVSLRWQVSGGAGGGAYSLVAADRAAGGNQCCCTYLPLILRNK